MIPVEGIYSSLEQHNVKAKVLKVDNPFYDDLRSFGAMTSLPLAPPTCVRNSDLLTTLEQSAE
jgi:hypothetical protein